LLQLKSAKIKLTFCQLLCRDELITVAQRNLVQKRLLISLFSSCTVLEAKWIILILLKEVTNCLRLRWVTVVKAFDDTLDPMLLATVQTVNEFVIARTGQCTGQCNVV
jgi:uncharacterized protein Smg (DUF494 family)